MKPAGFCLLAILAVICQECTAKGRKPLWSIDDAGQCYNRKKGGVRVMTCDAGKTLTADVTALDDQVVSLIGTVASMQDTINNQDDVIASFQAAVGEMTSLSERVVNLKDMVTEMQAALEKEETPEETTEETPQETTEETPQETTEETPLEEVPAGPASCKEIQEDDPNDGVHMLTVGGRQIQVYCDQTTDGGGWAVIQRRNSGSVDFNRGWEEYQQGFGDLNGEFWLGLDNIHALTSAEQQTLRVELEDYSGNTRYSKYSSFEVAGPSDNYRLTVSGYSGNTEGDALYHQNNALFSTKDRDNDQDSSLNCAQRHQGAWWYLRQSSGGCGFTNLNGPYKWSFGYDGMFWVFFQRDYRAMKRTQMKIRPSTPNSE